MGTSEVEPPSREAWRLMAEMMFSDESQERFHRACSASNLTPPLLKALLSMTPGIAVPMSVLAKGWRCDASWVTGIVDGLEQRGYVERRVPATDRRVKVVEITDAGDKAKSAAMECLYEPPASITDLDDEDQEALRHLVRKIRGGRDSRQPPGQRQEIEPG